MYTKIQAIQETFAEAISIPSSYTSRPHTGTISSQRGVAFKYGNRNRVLTGYNTTWVFTTPTGIADTATPTQFLIHKYNHLTQSAVCITASVPTVATFGRYVNGIRAFNDDNMTAGVVGGATFAVVGVRGTTPFSASYDVAAAFTLPAASLPAGDQSSERSIELVNIGDGRLAAIAYQSVYIKATDMFHEQIVQINDDGSKSFILNSSFKRRSTNQVTSTVDFGRLGEAGPSHFVFRENPEKNGTVGSNGFIVPISVAYIVEAQSGARIWEKTVNGNYFPGIRSTIHSDPTQVRINQTLLTRDFIHPNEGALIGGRFIALVSNGDTYTCLYKTAGGSTTSAEIATRSGMIPRVVFGISPNGEILVGWKDINDATQDVLVCYGAGGDEQWVVTPDDWDAFDRLVGKPMWAVTATTSSNAGHTSYVLFDAEGNANFHAFYVEQVTTTGAMRAPCFRYMFSMDTGKMYNSKSLYTVPGVSNTQQIVLGIYYTFDESSLACQTMFLVANSGSTYTTTNTTALSGAFKTMAMPIKTRLFFRVADQRGKILQYNTDYAVKAEVDGWYEWGEGDGKGGYSIPINPGSEYKVVFTGTLFAPNTQEGTYAKGTTPNPIMIVMMDKDWTRRDYIVSTPEDVLAIREDPMGNYNFSNDIDMLGVPYDTPFMGQDVAFMGVINGNGYKLTNLVATGDSSGSYGGLVGVAHNAQFVDLTITGANANASAGHGLGLLAGFYLKEPLFGPDDPIPATYTELEPRFSNLVIEDCTVQTQWGHSGIGIMFGVFTWRGYLDTLDYVFEQIVLRRNRLTGTNSGSSNTGCIVGQMDIENLNSGGGPS